MLRPARLAFPGLLLFAATVVYAQDPFDAFQHFSATMSGGALKAESIPVYRLGNLMRANLREEYRITNLVERSSWFITPKKCSRSGLPDAATYPFSTYTNFSVERSPLDGKETIDGHSCKLENVIFKPKDGRPIIIKMKLWEAEDLEGFPVQIEVEPANFPKFTINYSNVSLAPPDRKLFQRPPSCPAETHVRKKKTTQPGTPKTQKVSPKTSQ